MPPAVGFLSLQLDYCPLEVHSKPQPIIAFASKTFFDKTKLECMSCNFSAYYVPSRSYRTKQALKMKKNFGSAAETAFVFLRLMPGFLLPAIEKVAQLSTAETSPINFKIVVES